jgi:hypothetical protein
VLFVSLFAVLNVGWVVGFGAKTGNFKRAGLEPDFWYEATVS